MHREWLKYKPFLFGGGSNTWRVRIKHAARHTIRAVKATEAERQYEWILEMRKSLNGPLWA